MAVLAPPRAALRADLRSQYELGDGEVEQVGEIVKDSFSSPELEGVR